MKRAVQAAVILLLWAGVSAGQAVIDRLVATVNGQPILQSDWDTAVRCEALLDQKPLQFTPEAARATLQRLIDRELLRQQIRTFQLRPISEDEIRERLQEIRKQMPGAGSEAGWKADLARYGLSRSEVEENIADQLEILRFVDVRLRPTVRVNRSSIEAYYRENLLPEIRQKGGKEVPLAEVSPQIEEILLQRLMNAQLAELLRELRQQSEIDIQAAAPGPASKAHATEQAQTPHPPPAAPEAP